MSSWAGKRRAAIIGIISLILLSTLLIFGFSIFYETPTCFDRKQNQNELGVDCGGSCTTLCAFQVEDAPVVTFVRALAPQSGRVDIVAQIENRNDDAQAVKAPFHLDVYDVNRNLITQTTIEVDLPPKTSVPIYVADVAPRGSTASQAFLVAGDITWTKAETLPVLPTVSEVLVMEGEAPRVTATLVNPLARAVYNTKLVAIVRDASGNVIAGSQTIVPTLPPQGTAPIIFTWNVPFSAPSPRVDIYPVPELSSRAP